MHYKAQNPLESRIFITHSHLPLQKNDFKNKKMLKKILIFLTFFKPNPATWVKDFHQS